MAFRIEITQVVKFPSLWSLTKLQDFSTHVYLSMRGPTLPFAPTKTYGPISVDLGDKFLSLLFSFLSLSLSAHLSALPFFFSISLFLFFLFLILLFYFYFYYYYFFFSFFLLVLSFSLFPLLNTWFNVSHSHKCTI